LDTAAEPAEFHFFPNATKGNKFDRSIFLLVLAILKIFAELAVPG